MRKYGVWRHFTLSEFGELELIAVLELKKVHDVIWGAQEQK